MKSKPWYQSKTIWISILGTLAGVFSLIAGNENVPPHVVSYLLSGVSVLNFVVRFITDQPIQNPLDRGNDA